MSIPVIGTLNMVDAFQLDEQIWLVGTGDNPSTGWKNAFQPSFEGDSQFVFVQYEPSGYVIWVMRPFIVTQLIIGEPPLRNIVVRLKDADGSVINKDVPVRKILTPSDYALMQLYQPIDFYPGDDPRIQKGYEEGQKSRSTNLYKYSLRGTFYRRAIGSLDNPLDCCGCCRNYLPYCDGSRTTWYIEVRTSTIEEIGTAVEDCLRMAAIAAALAAVVAALATGGVALSVAIDAFIAVLKPCLIAKFGGAVEVSVNSQYECK